MQDRMIVFRPYPFQVGQKIHIEGGPRRGDWVVLEVTEKKVRLQCPISGKDYLWDLFCYAVDERPTMESLPRLRKGGV